MEGRKTASEESVKFHTKRKSGPLLAHTLILGIFSCWIPIVSCMNLITGFPDDLYVSKDDSVGFLLRDFINGTRIYREVFPEPFVKTPMDDDSVEISQELLQNCRLTLQTRPLEMISICQDANQKDLVTVHHLNSDLSLMLKYENKIFQSSDWEKDEVLTNVYYHESQFFASSKVLNPSKSMYTVKAYMFELVYPNDPAKPYDDVAQTNPSPKLAQLGTPLKIPDFMTPTEAEKHPIIKVQCVSN